MQLDDVYTVCWKKTINKEYYIQQNYPSKIREKLRYYQTNKKMKEFIANRPTLQEILAEFPQAKGKEH